MVRIEKDVQMCEAVAKRKAVAVLEKSDLRREVLLLNEGNHAQFSMCKSVDVVSQAGAMSAKDAPRNTDFAPPLGDARCKFRRWVLCRGKADRDRGRAGRFDIR